MGSRNALLVSLALLVCACASRSTTSPPPEPELVLWAWHGEHDLRFLGEDEGEAGEVAVAYLARRLVVADGGVRPQIRHAPLRLHPKTRRTAVVRIELETQMEEAALQEALPTLLEHVKVAAREPGVEALQIDFDAPKRFRPLYRSLLRDIRQELPKNVRLEMTALASWCLDDPWIGEGLVDAVVPMLFEMGRESKAIRKRLASSPRRPECRANTGISITDVLPPIGRPERIFVFAPGSWTRERLDAVRVGLATGAWSASREGWKSPAPAR